MLDHLVIYTSPSLHEATVAFYLAALAPLGYQKLVSMFDGIIVGLGATSPDFWINAERRDVEHREVTNAHFAFRADGRVEDQATVDACYAKGLEAGGKDNGKPGLRPQYDPKYYGGFLYDPIGNVMEVVHRGQ
ncbi:hypothetical protein MMC27_000451 [Xylographa pallens]|nr:hypothetical protein [Xylographa pallens]